MQIGSIAVSIRQLALTLLVFATGCTGLRDVRHTNTDDTQSSSQVQTFGAEEIQQALGASDAEWPAARDRLICKAPDVLRTLDGSRISETDLSRVKDFISSALLNRIPYDTFRTTYRSLDRLVAAEIQARREMAKTLPSDRFISLGGNSICPLDDCPETALERVQNAFKLSPGLSVPAVMDLIHDKRPTTRVQGLLMIVRLRAVTAIRAFALLHDDVAEVGVGDGDTDFSKLQVRNFAALTPELAILYSRWHPPTRSGDDLTEREMTRAVHGICRSETEFEKHPAPRFISRDAWNRPMRVSDAGTGGFVVLWSAGPNGQAGDEDDVVRYRRDCHDAGRQIGEQLVWTAAGGGVTALPAETKALCE